METGNIVELFQKAWDSYRAVLEDGEAHDKEELYNAASSASGLPVSYLKEYEALSSNLATCLFKNVGMPNPHMVVIEEAYSKGLYFNGFEDTFIDYIDGWITWTEFVVSCMQFVQDDEGGVYSKDGKVFVKWLGPTRNISYKIRDGVESILQNAFDIVTAVGSCPNPGVSFSRLDFPNSLKTIGDGAFYGAWNLVLHFPDSLEQIGIGAFAHTHIKEISFGAGLKTIERAAFSGSTLYELNLPDTVTSIGDNAFEWNHLESIKLPNNLVNLGSEAFLHCGYAPYPNKKGEMIEERVRYSVTIPRSLVHIGAAPFADSLIEKLSVEKGNPNIYVQDGMLIDKKSQTLLQCITYKRQVKIKPGIKNIANKAFYHLPKLNKILIPSTVVSIGEDAVSCYCEVDFKNKHYVSDRGALIEKSTKTLICLCSKLQIVKIPDGVKKICHYAVRADNVKHIVVPSSVREIEGYSFYLSLSKLKIITFNISRYLPKIDSVFFNNLRIWYDYPGVEIRIPKKNVETFKCRHYWHNIKAL